jgi:RND family efflux transporter MFP subunit
MIIFKRASFYVAILGILAAAKLAGQLRKTPPAPTPLVEPARSPFSNTVAATGIIEASRENVRVGTSKPGLLTKIFAEVGSRVKEGDLLFQLDDREARAKVVTARSQVDALRAALKAEQIMANDAADQFQRVDKLQKDKVASDDERTRKEFQLQNWQARVVRLDADIQAAQAIADQAQVELDVLTIHAPRDGVILQVNVRSGEFADTKPNEPMMILGEVDRLQIRADVDEQNAPLVQTNQPAVAFLKGSTRNSLPLRFVRIEPYVIPKKSLTGDSAERVDTRVLQIIYELDRSPVPLYVGQQVDVFINRPSEAAFAEPAPPERR